MADTPEKKTLDEISNTLKNAKASEKELKDTLEKSMLSFPAESFKTMTAETSDQIKKQRSELKARLQTPDQQQENNENGFFNGLSKFLGVDYRDEQFNRLEGIKTGFDGIKTGLKDLGKALALDKLGKKAGGFWDFLKKVFGAGLATVGILEFINGFNKADEIFGKNADFSEKLSAGLANVIGSFTGLTEGEIAELAFKIDEVFTNIYNFVSAEVVKVQNTLRSSMDEFGTIFEGFKLIFDGEFLPGISKLGEGFGGLAVELYNSESILAKAILAVAAVKVVTTITTLFTTIGTVFSALSTIAAGIGTAFAAVGGVAGLTAFVGTIGTILLPALAVIGAIFAALAAIPAMIDAIGAGWEKYKETGSIWEALKTGIGTFIDKFLKYLISFASFGYLDGDKIMEDIYSAISGIFAPVTTMLNDVLVWIQRKAARIIDAVPGLSSLIDTSDWTGLQENANMSYDPDYNKSGQISNYDQLMSAISQREDLTNAEKDRLMNEAKAAAAREQSLSNFVQQNSSTINNLNIKPEPQTSKTHVDDDFAAMTVN